MHDPRLAVQALFAYWGHYGVQIFMFLSAYGLATRYWDQPMSWGQFIWSRVKKIYPTFLLSVLLWALFIGAMIGILGPIGSPRKNAAALLLTFLGVQNLAPGFGLPPVGPWWFLPFIMQFYCLWPAFRRFGARFGIPGLLLLCCASVALVDVANGSLIRRWQVNLLETPLGHVSELCLGVAAARYGMFSKRWAGVVGALLFAATMFIEPLRPLRFVAVLTFALWLYMLVRDHARHCRPLIYLGGCSMALFFVNGFTRYPFLVLAIELKTWFWGLLLGFVSAGFAVILAQIVAGTEKKLRAI
jgi:peptidoglycan/LPS O-acetylase OafA/YrhL